MSRSNTLKSLEVVLESFLDRAVLLKADRMAVLSGINRLDDIARSSADATGPELTDQIGRWFAEHRNWMEDQSLRKSDQNRIREILSNIRHEFGGSTGRSPAEAKISAEIDRWQSELTRRRSVEPETSARPKRKLVLRKGPESMVDAGVHPSSQDSIGLFAASLQTISGIFADLSHDRRHLMSILDDTLKSATLQKNRDALLLSALVIYYLKQNGYMVEPFVKRLKEAERLHKESAEHA